MSDVQQNQLLESETAFGLNFVQFLLALPGNESFVFSPLSISLALSLLHAGANGNTKNEIRDAILKGATDEQLMEHFAKVSDELKNSKSNVVTSVANRIFAKNGFEIKKEYLEEVEKQYQAGAENLDFNNGEKSAETVNKFVSDNTGGKIPTLVTPDQFSDAVAFIVNAVYFKGKWFDEFTATSTHEGDFHVDGETTIQLPYMRKFMSRENYASDDLFEVLSLNYKDLSYSMAIFLPKERFGLADAIGKLDAERFQKLLDDLRGNLINFTLPKFKITKQFGLKTAAETLGIKTTFTDGANFDKMADDVKISDGVHKAVIEVDEAGTVAAAATGFKIVPLSMPMGDPIDFTPDHSFLFALLKDKHPIFLGVFNGV